MVTVAGRSKLGFLLAVGFVLVSCSRAAVGAERPLQVDLQGDTHYSRFNFTDLRFPYDASDGWAELKVSLRHAEVSPYVSVIGSTASSDLFWWQRNTQFGVGVQWYPYLPLPRDTVDDFSRGLRFFALLARRDLPERPSGVKSEDGDLQVGLDYYHDTIFDPGVSVNWAAWTNATYRSTNFSASDYDAFLWTGNVRVGRKIRGVFAYALADWTWVPKYQTRFWENFLRAGVGVRWYPFREGKGGFEGDLKKRFNVYAETINNVTWLGDEPTGRVNDTDFRIGISFSTGGFFGE